MSNTVDIKEMKELTNPSAAPEERIYQTFYPKTHVKGVVVDENNRLDEVLDSIVEDAETAATEAATVVKDQCEEIRTDMNNQLLASDLTFDISKNNLTSGQPTEYADLTAALGSGGGNIPEDYRKGGMTVKFIENTNHTYLQYRLMNKNFSTVVSDWQGVDEEILSGSKNLITSDGVVKALSNTAKQDGYYSQMTVGSAENLVGQTVDSEAYLIRPTGGESNEVANGVASVLGMEGNSCVWNQNIPDYSEITTASSNASKVDGKLKVEFTAENPLSYAGRFYLNNKVNIIKGHKYYSCYKVNYSLNHSANVSGYVSITSDNGMSSALALGSIGKGQGTNEYRSSVKEAQENSSISQSQLLIGRYPVKTPLGDWVEIWDINIIDLTLLGIDNLTTTAQVEAWLAEHVGTKPYYGYNAGSLLSAQTLGIKTYGQNLLNPTTRQARLIPYTWEENSNVYTIKNVPSGATATFTPDATGVAETVDISGGSLNITNYGSGILELSAATSDTYVCMKWDEGKDDDIVPFEEHTQNFDVRKVYGKVNGTGEYVQCFPNGLRSAGSAHDTLSASEAVNKVGSVSMETLRWSYNSGYQRFQTSVNNMKFFNGVSVVPNILAARYNTISFNTYYAQQSAENPTDLQISYHNADRIVLLRNLSYTNVTSFVNAMTGVLINYELATPITYTDLIYRDGGIDRPLTDDLFNIDVDNWSIEEQLLTPYDENGNPTSIPATIKTQYGMDAVEEIDTIKHTYVSAYSEQNFSDSQKAQARRNIGAVEEDGSYPNMSVGIAKNLAGENAVEAEYTYRPSNGTIGTNTGIANLTDVKGKTLKWNQLVKNGNFANNTLTGWALNSNITTAFSNRILEVSGIFGSVYFSQYNSIPVGHKVLLSLKCGYFGNATGTATLFAINNNIVKSIPIDNTIAIRTSIITAPSGNSGALGFTSYVAGGIGDTTLKIDCDYGINIIDLTDLFGAGNEPTTVAEFEALYPFDYYDYTATPVLINNNASAIETTGFNQWDEEWVTYESTRIKTKNPIRLIKGAIYYFKANFTGYMYMSWLNMDGTPAGSNAMTPNQTFEALADYLIFYTPTGTGGTYQNDICINLSDTAKNGTYEPYEKHTFYFDKVLQGEGSLATIKGKLDGEGESVVVFPDGLRKAGNVFDEIKGNVAIKRIGSVDLGTLNWVYSQSNKYFQVDKRQASSGIPSNMKLTEAQTIINAITSNYIGITYQAMSSDGVDSHNLTFASSDPYFVIKNLSYTDAAAFKAAISGVMLYYELATPETYILDQTVTGGYQVNALGTEQRLPKDTASAVNAPVSYSVIYPIDAVGTITKLPINYISEKSLTNFTTELASKLGTFLNASINISASYDQTSQEYNYTITITQN